MPFIVVFICSTPLLCTVFTLWLWMLKICFIHIRVFGDCVNLIYLWLQWHGWGVCIQKAQARNWEFWSYAEWTKPFTLLSGKQQIFRLSHTTTMSVCPLTTAITQHAMLVPLNRFFAYSTRVLYWSRVTFNIPRGQQQGDDNCCWLMNPVELSRMNPVYTSCFKLEWIQSTTATP